MAENVALPKFELRFHVDANEFVEVHFRDSVQWPCTLYEHQSAVELVFLKPDGSRAIALSREQAGEIARALSWFAETGWLPREFDKNGNLPSLPKRMSTNG